VEHLMMTINVPAQQAEDLRPPLGSTVHELTDPQELLSHARVADVRIQVTAPGNYKARLIKTSLHRLSMQEVKTTLAHIGYYAIPRNRSAFFFLDDYTSIHHTSKELGPDQLVMEPINSEHHHRAPADAHWRSLSLSPEDLAAAGNALIGRELTSPAALRVIRPPPHLGSRLRRLHQAIGHLADGAPDIIACPEAARAMEQALVQALVECISAGMSEDATVPSHTRALVMRRFEQLLEAHQGETLYLAEVCAKIGVSGRTLRSHSQEHLGMSPHKYLQLRRMNLVRRALTLADAEVTTVTVIVTDHGFWELGRFAVAYRRLFGESPSVTLRRAPDYQPQVRGWSPFVVEGALG
jgi:AraC-like DNA-binding protein